MTPKNNETKARFWWIIGGEFSGTTDMEDIEVTVLSYDPKDPCTKVIEYSAYELLEKKLEILRTLLLDPEGNSSISGSEEDNRIITETLR